MRSSTLIAHLAGEHRRTRRDGARIAELRVQIREAQVIEWAEHQLAEYPPLSQATRDKIAALIHSGGARVPSS